MGQIFSKGRLALIRSLLLIPILAATAFGQIQPDALRLVRNLRSAFQQFSTGEIETENTAIYLRTGKPLTISALLQWKAPDKVRLTIGTDSAGETSGSDGHYLTTYSKLSHAYSKRDGTLSLDVALTRALANLIHIGESDPDLAAAKIVRDEALSVGSSDLPCAVVELEIRPKQTPPESRSYTLWIDKATGLPLKQQMKIVRSGGEGPTESTTTSTTTLIVRRLVLDRPVDEKLFRLDPPPGSKVSGALR